jgi:CelD/BcsL family acetyltransferase involved in cellulose biosynthesis
MLNFLIGSPAETLLKEEKFLQQWTALYHSCPWATPFQSVGFVSTWYDIYRSEYEPILLTERDENNDLQGLLTLALCRDSGQLVCAGVYHSEYHVWLATPEKGNSFIAAAMDLLSQKFPQQSLTFQYLPPSTPKEWLTDRGGWGKNSQLVTYRRPIMRLGDGQEVAASWRKSSNKSRFNRLKRLGEVKFEQILTQSDYTAVFDDIVTYYDLRKGAVNGVTYFFNDPLQKPFHLALMNVPNLLHVTVLRVGGKLVSAQVGLIDDQPQEKQIGFSLSAHSPFEARHSPGKLHMLMLAQEVIKQGFDTIDLTPGGDPWKERFANDHDDTHRLSVYFSRRSAQIAGVKLRLKQAIERRIRSAGMNKSEVQALARQVRDLRWNDVAGYLRRWWQKFWCRWEYRVYVYPHCDVLTPDRVGPLKQDHLDDLFLFPSDPQHPRSRQNFLSQALERLESGQRLYTRSQQNCLEQWGWLWDSPDKCWLPEVEQEYIFPPESAWLSDYQSIRDNADLDRAAIKQMVDDAISNYGAQQVYTIVRSDHLKLQALLNQVGFTHTQSLYRHTTLGKTRRWIGDGGNDNSSC